MFTLEIKGKAVAVIYADEENARELLDDEDFQEDLQALESDGEPLWNGEDPLTIRAASKAEIASADGNTDPDEAPEDDEEGELMVSFIVPLDDDDEDEA